MQTEDINPILDLLKFVVFVFLLVVLLPVFGKVKYYQGYICANAFIPFYFISTSLKLARSVGEEGERGCVAGVDSLEVGAERAVVVRAHARGQKESIAESELLLPVHADGVVLNRRLRPRSRGGRR